MAYLKPQSPIKNGEDHIYPLTTVDQIMMDDGNRLSGVGVFLEKPDESTDTTLAGVNATTLDGKLASEYALKTDFDAFRTLMLDTIYPIGSIYMSVVSTSPTSLFGGTWTQITGRYLIGTGAPELNDDGTSPGDYNYAAENKGGEAEHTLTVNEMPAHNHNTGYGYWFIDKGTTTSAISKDYIAADGASPNVTSHMGGGAAHNNMPPYLAVYMWKRTA